MLRNTRTSPSSHPKQGAIMSKKKPDQSAFTEGMKIGLRAGLFPFGHLIDALINLDDDIADDELAAEERRNELEMQIYQAKARAAQEWAIAERILSATEIEVEEYYEGHGEGGLGFNANVANQTVNLGAHGSGRKVTRRVVRLKRWAPRGEGEGEVEVRGDLDELNNGKMK